MSVSSIASYVADQCTAEVASLYSWVQAGWGNAYQWYANAQKAGYAVSQTPVPGSIAVWGSNLPGSGGFGHVAAVDTVNSNGSFTVTEANYSRPAAIYGSNDVDTRTVPSNSPDLLGFILPPTASAYSASSSSSSNSDAGISGAISGAESALQTFVQRAAWVLLAVGLVVTGLLLLLVDEGGREVEKNPELLEALA